MTTQIEDMWPSKAEASQPSYDLTPVFVDQTSTLIMYPNLPHDKDTTDSFLVWARGASQTPPRDVEEILYLRFRRLADQWRRDTGGLSLISRKCAHPAYLRIIGLGKRVIPLILEELQQEPDHWFPALRALTGENPVPPEEAGRMSRMAKAWVNWGRDRGYLE
jgi:hypothetical protein